MYPYNISGSEWAVVYLTKDITPELYADFMVVNHRFHVFPSYYVTDQRKLYIVYDRKISPSDYIDLYVDEDIVHQVLLENVYHVEPSKSINMGKLFLEEQITESDQQKEIKDVLSNISHSAQLPKHIKEKLLKKYQ
nr:hypothetical protein [Abalone asfa-like virus]